MSELPIDATSYVQVQSQQFGINEDAFSEIEETIQARLRDRALRLASDGLWEKRGVELSQVHGGGQLGHFLCVNDLTCEFGEALHPLLIETGEEYVEMLTQTIVEHRGQSQPIRWETIVEQATRLCCRETEWERSSEWLGKMLWTAGFNSGVCHPRTRVNFESVLLAWMVIWHSWDDKKPMTSFHELARRRIRHIARRAPEVSIRMVAAQQKAETPIPTLIELRNKGVISQKRAAQYLRCEPRTIRNYLRIGELTKTERGLVICDDKLIRKLRQKFGSAVR